MIGSFSLGTFELVSAAHREVKFKSNLPKVSECREGLDAILLRGSLVVDLHEVNTERVGVVVDFLELREYCITRHAASGI